MLILLKEGGEFLAKEVVVEPGVEVDLPDFVAAAQEFRLVGINSLERDIELACHFLWSQPLGEEVEYFPLS